ncbi:MAG: putative toxin-antitoxin system toxin component, PIN family [Syntrophobacteraceae bacterium]
MKVVLDSNIYVSAFGYDRGPERIIDLGLATNFRIYSSLYIIEEVTRVLHERLGMSQRFAELAGRRITRYSTVVPIRGSSLKGPSPLDPKDGPIIKTCLASRADFLVTGDKELWSVAVRGLEIVNPTQFLRHLRHQGIT